MLYYLYNNDKREQVSYHEPSYFIKSLQILREKEAILDDNDGVWPIKEQLRYYKQEAQKGDHIFESLLGSLYFEGKLIRRNYKKAFEWSIKAAEHGIGLDESQYYVGLMYASGKGVKKDLFQAKEWLLKAVVQDNIFAMIRLATMMAGIKQKDIMMDYE